MMSRISLVSLAAGLLVVGFLLLATGSTQPVQPNPGNLNVHVHDDYYHPAGTFGSPTDHNAAQAACIVANPAEACDAQINVGDTITWVVPGSPATVNPHTVTECTDNTFTTCGANVDPNNPIGDTGVKQPNQWPSGPITFTAVGTYYYRCDVHPGVMRGRVVVSQAPSPSPSPTAAPTVAPTASPAPSPTAVPTASPASVPITGGSAGEDGTSLWSIWLLLAGGTLVIGTSALALRSVRRR